MRLLEILDDNTYNLTPDLIVDIPPYAILSHTWGGDGEEVTFEDLLDSNTANKKKGWEKIRFCGEQTARDMLRYFWVDTCCINKSSSSELTEAINSMFRWYAEATRCYVYLPDVPAHAGWKSNFRNSRWFTRGWTLQELIAPASVEFFCPDPDADWYPRGRRLGDKRLLESEICEITGIDVKALRGEDLSEFSVEERVSWAAKRNTARKEDKAYCLLGILGVYMPLIYGEGDNAFARLEEVIEKRFRNTGSTQKGVRKPLSWANLVGKKAIGKLLTGGDNVPQSVNASNNYNCSTPLSLVMYRGIYMKHACPACHWVYRDETEPGLGHPKLADGVALPPDILFQLFHCNNWGKFVFRCFICQDGKAFDLPNMKDHIKEQHIYNEICG